MIGSVTPALAGLFAFTIVVCAWLGWRSVQPPSVKLLLAAAGAMAVAAAWPGPDRNKRGTPPNGVEIAPHEARPDAGPVCPAAPEHGEMLAAPDDEFAADPPPPEMEPLL